MRTRLENGEWLEFNHIASVVAVAKILEVVLILLCRTRGGGNCVCIVVVVSYGGSHTVEDVMKQFF